MKTIKRMFVSVIALAIIDLVLSSIIYAGNKKSMVIARVIQIAIRIAIWITFISINICLILGGYILLIIIIIIISSIVGVMTVLYCHYTNIDITSGNVIFIIQEINIIVTFAIILVII